MSGHARALNYGGFGSMPSANGTAVMGGTRIVEAPPINNPYAKKVRATAERAREKELSGGRVKPEARVAKGQRISMLSIAGALIVAVLMVFVVLAQINYLEAGRETVMLNSQLVELTETHRMLELAFVSAIDIREVERVARDELGMSRPDATQVVLLSNTVTDSAVVVNHYDDSNVQSFISYLASLVDYFR